MLDRKMWTSEFSADFLRAKLTGIGAVVPEQKKAGSNPAFVDGFSNTQKAMALE